MAKLIVNFAVASLLVFNIVTASSLQSRVDLEQENAVESNYQDNFAPDQIREKRKINQIQQAKDGIKSAVIGLVFGAKTNVKSSLVNLAFGNKNTAPQQTYPTSPRTTTTDDTPIFDRKKVSLALPGELFGQGFSIITNISQIVGDVIMNSAQRKERIFNATKPIGQKILAFKGYTADGTQATSG